MTFSNMIAIKDLYRIKKGEEASVYLKPLTDEFVYFYKIKPDAEYVISDVYPTSILYDIFRDKTEDEKTVEVCECCEKNIFEGDTYLEDPEAECYYCSDCYESHTTTAYFVGGEFVGVGDDGWYEN